MFFSSRIWLKILFEKKMNNLGGGANNGHNAQSLAAEGVVERGRWVYITNSFLLHIERANKCVNRSSKCPIYRMHIYNCMNFVHCN